MKQTFKLENLKELFFEECSELGFEFVERTEWIGEGKCETCQLIFKYIDDTFVYYVSRSGSHFTDWTYDWEYETDETVECIQVRAIEVTRTEWVAV